MNPLPQARGSDANGCLKGLFLLLSDSGGGPHPCPLGVPALCPHIQRTPEPLEAPSVDPLFAQLAHEDALAPLEMRMQSKFTKSPKCPGVSDTPGEPIDTGDDQHFVAGPGGKSRTVFSSSRLAVVVPLRFSARITLQPPALSAVC